MIRLNDVIKKYKNSDFCLKIKNLSLPSNGFFVVKGQSGFGKTTLINILGILDSAEGEYYLNGINMNVKHLKREKLRTRYFSYMFPDFKLIDNKSVQENLSFIIKKDYEMEVLKKLDIDAFYNKKVNELSAGQKQRVCLARMILEDKPIILADEPTSNLDQYSAKLVLDMLNELSKEKLVVMASHETELLEKYTYQEILVAPGKDISYEYDSDDQIKNFPFSNNGLPIKMKYGLTDFIKNIIVFSMMLVMLFTSGFTEYSYLCYEKCISRNLIANHERYLKVVESCDENYNGQLLQANNENGYGFYSNQENIDYYFLNSVPLSSSTNDLLIEGYVTDKLDNLEIENGKMPSKDNEIVISDVLYEYLGNEDTLISNGISYSIVGTFVSECRSLNSDDDFAFEPLIVFAYDCTNFYTNISIESYNFAKKYKMNEYGREEAYLFINNNDYNLLYGREPASRNEVLINKTYFTRYLNSSLENLKEYSFDFYNCYSSRKYFSPYINNNNISIVGVVDDGSYNCNAYFDSSNYNEMSKLYNKFFTSIVITERNDMTIRKILRSETLNFESYQSDGLYCSYKELEFLFYILLPFTILLLVITLILLIKNYVTYLMKKKNDISINVTNNISIYKILGDTCLKNIALLFISIFFALLITPLTLNAINGLVLYNTFEFAVTPIIYYSFLSEFIVGLAMILLISFVLLLLIEIFGKKNIIYWLK